MDVEYYVSHIDPIPPWHWRHSAPNPRLHYSSTLDPYKYKLYFPVGVHCQHWSSADKCNDKHVSRPVGQLSNIYLYIFGQNEGGMVAFKVTLLQSIIWSIDQMVSRSASQSSSQPASQTPSNEWMNEWMNESWFYYTHHRLLTLCYQ